MPSIPGLGAAIRAGVERQKAAVTPSDRSERSSTPESARTDGVTMEDHLRAQPTMEAALRDQPGLAAKIGSNVSTGVQDSVSLAQPFSAVEASRNRVDSARHGYETALEHEREPDLTTARNNFDNALDDHIDVLNTRKESLEKQVAAAEEHGREPDLSTAKKRLEDNTNESIATRRELTELRTGEPPAATPDDIAASRDRVDAAQQGYEAALEHEREPDLSTATEHYQNTLETHVDLLESRTPVLERALAAAQEHERQPDLSIAENRLDENKTEIRDTEILLQILEDDATIVRSTKTLELGDRGPAVTQLQDRLKELGYEPGISDGWFGNNTLGAARDFQQDQIEALEAQRSVAEGRESIIALDKQIADVTAESRAATVGPATQNLLENPAQNPLEVDTSDYGEIFADQYPDAAELLGTGNYEDHLLRGVDLSLDVAEQKTNDFNGGDNHLVVQSIFDPVVANKNTTVDEYSVVVELPPGVDPQSVMLQLATDMDQFLGGDFKEQGDFKNQGEVPEVGQVIDIDVLNGPFGLDSPFNAPVIISHIDDTSFSVQTIEYNNAEHLLHGTREWGFEEQDDGTVRFYTRGISVEDVQAAEGGFGDGLIPGPGNAKEGEKAFWTAWVDGIENYAESNGGNVVDDTRIINQTQGPTGEQFWQTLPSSQQEEIRSSQVDGHEREAQRLEGQFDVLVPAVIKIDDFDELEGHQLIERAIRDGDTDRMMRQIRRVIRDNEDSDDRDVQDALDALEGLHDDLRITRRLAGEHRSEAAGWRER